MISISCHDITNTKEMELMKHSNSKIEIFHDSSLVQRRMYDDITFSIGSHRLST